MIRLILSLVALLCVAACATKPQGEFTSFEKAVPVWSEGRETEKNLTLSFREVIKIKHPKEASIRLTASCDYRLRVNGEFVAHGPCRSGGDSGLH